MKKHNGGQESMLSGVIACAVCGVPKDTRRKEGIVRTTKPSRSTSSGKISANLLDSWGFYDSIEESRVKRSRRKNGLVCPGR